MTPWIIYIYVYFIILFIYLFLAAGSLLLYGPLSSCSELGLLSANSCGAWGSHCLSCCGAQAPGLRLSGCGTWALLLWRMGFVALWRVGSSWTRDQTRIPCIGSRIPHHWAKLNSTSLMGIDEGCWCSSVFTLFRGLDGSLLCVLETQQDLYLFCSQNSSERCPYSRPFLTSPSSSAPCIMTFFPWLLTACLHQLPLLGHPHARRLSCVFRAQPGPSLYNMPQGPKLSLTLCLHLGCSLCLAHLSLISLPFVTNSTVSPLEILHWPLPPTLEDTGVFPSLCPHKCEQTAGTELPVQCHREAHVRLFRWTVCFFILSS